MASVIGLGTGAPEHGRGRLHVAASGEIVSSDANAAGLFGFPTPDALCGRGLESLVGNGDLEAVQAALASPSSGTLLASLCTVDRREIEVCISVGRVTADAARIVDIRALDSACPLRPRSRRLRIEEQELFQSLQVGVLVQGPASEMLFWNQTALDLLGMSEGQLTGRTSFDPRWNVIHPDGSDFPGPTHPVPVALATKRPVRGVVMGVFRPTRDDRVWLSVDAMPRLDDAGDLRDVVVTFTDVTAQRRLADEISMTQKHELVSRIAGGMAHDFNNMLAVIMAVADIGTADAASERAASLFREIVATAQRGSQLTRKLLSLAGRAVDHRTKLVVDTQISQVAGLVRHAIGEEIELTLELGADGAVTVADPTRLEQAVLNLALNGRDAMPDGGELTLRTQLHHTGAEPAVRIEVRDTGEGIPPELADQVFEPFFTTKSVERGTGLGLPSVRSFATELAGSITYESSPAGTCFALTLPCTVEHGTSPNPGLLSSAAPGAASSMRDRCVLVVDNEPGVRRVVAETLRRAGCSVMVAADGPTALDVLAANEIDLLVTDIIMPRMDGATLANQARERNPSLPVLFMSGFVGEHGDDLPASSQITRFLAKPFTAEQLQTTAAAVLEHRTRDTTHAAAQSPP